MDERIPVFLTRETFGLIEQLARPFVDHEPEDVLHRELSAILGSRSGPTVLPSAQAPTVEAVLEDPGGDATRRSYAAAKSKGGRDLVMAGGIWAQWSDGARVALPYAFERKPSRWWLGITESQFLNSPNSRIALLCRCAAGAVFAIELDASTASALTKNLKVATNGQYMFNVKIAEGRFLIEQPGKEALDVSRFVNHWEGSALVP